MSMSYICVWTVHYVTSVYYTSQNKIEAISSLPESSFLSAVHSHLQAARFLLSDFCLRRLACLFLGIR